MPTLTMITDGDLGGAMSADGGTAGDPATFFPRLWDWAIRQYKIHNVLDIGCGEGWSTQWFEDHGLAALGVEGSKVLIDRAAALHHPVVFHDLRQGPFFAPAPVDLVWCCEVVEHVDIQYLPHLVQTLSQGRVLMVTHAFPGQGGHHHVNCQPSEYWIKIFTDAGMKLDANNMSYEIAGQDCQGWSTNHWTRSGLIFVK